MRYEVVVEGEFGPLLSAAFRDRGIQTALGRTVLTADVLDPAEFYALVNRIQDFGLEIVSVQRLERPAMEPGRG